MSPRLQGQRISPSQRLAYAAALRALWTANPDATLRELCAKTGASVDLAQDVRKRLIAVGVLKAKGGGRVGT